jgi:hypothetical protein
MFKPTDYKEILGSLHKKPTLLSWLSMMMQVCLLISASSSLDKPGYCQTCVCKAVIEALLEQHFETDPTYC